MAKGKHRARSVSARWRSLSLLVTGLLMGTLFLTPAGAHFTQSTLHLGKHVWRQVIKDKVYTKAQSDGRFQSPWALVAADGSITDQSGGLSATKGGGDGRYYVNFGMNLTGRPILVTPMYMSANDNEIRAAKSVPCGGTAVPGGVTCPVLGTNNAQTAYVEILDGTDTTIDTNFYIVLPPAG